jgi:hypothetical protein
MNSATEPFSTMSARVGEHRVADGELGGVQSRLLDDAGDVPAGHDRKTRVDEAAQVALADLVVDGVDPAATTLTTRVSGPTCGSSRSVSSKRSLPPKSE